MKKIIAVRLPTRGRSHILSIWGFRSIFACWRQWGDQGRAGIGYDSGRWKESAKERCAFEDAEFKSLSSSLEWLSHSLAGNSRRII